MHVGKSTSMYNLESVNVHQILRTTNTQATRGHPSYVSEEVPFQITFGLSQGSLDRRREMV